MGDQVDTLIPGGGQRRFLAAGAVRAVVNTALPASRGDAASGGRPGAALPCGVGRPAGPSACQETCDNRVGGSPVVETDLQFSGSRTHEPTLAASLFFIGCLRLQRPCCRSAASNAAIGAAAYPSGCVASPAGGNRPFGFAGCSKFALCSPTWNRKCNGCSDGLKRRPSALRKRSPKTTSIWTPPGSNSTTFCGSRRSSNLAS